MALKANPIWGYAKTPHFHVGLPDLGPRPCGFALDFRVLNKWECSCVGVLAQTPQRAITPVEDEKPSHDMESSGAIQRPFDMESTGFHKDMNLLPSKPIPP